MLQRTIFFWAIFVLAACQDIQKNPPLSGSPVSPSRHKFPRQILEKRNSSAVGCTLLNPDTSVAGIRLRDAASARRVIVKTDRMDESDQYHFYSFGQNEILTLTQHAGNGQDQISIFKVSYAANPTHAYRKLAIDVFKTEKGIALGMSMSQLVALLGNCYVARDSSADAIELYYSLETPADSKTSILKTNHMPVYFGSYRFLKNRLHSFEFGFPYP